MGCFVPPFSTNNNLSVAPRCGSLVLSLSADARSSDDVIAFEGT